MKVIKKGWQRIMCACGKHGRGIRGVQGGSTKLGHTLFQCPHCSATWIRKVYRKPKAD